MCIRDRDKYLVTPSRYPELAALVGETSDNLPGVPGVGPKTAAKSVSYTHLKIVCTIGPATDSAAAIVDLVNAGMNVARLNMSHGDHVLHAKRVEWIRDAARAVGRPVGILLSLIHIFSRFLPPVRLGGVRLDLSFTVLYFALLLLLRWIP